MQTQFREPEVSRHKCLIYGGDPSEQLPVVIPFLRDSLDHNWRCLYLGSPEMVGMVDTALACVGVNTASEAERGALVLSSGRSLLEDGRFDPQKMIDNLCTMIDSAVDEGFEGLCATGDMRWELGADKNFDLLLDYEALLEQVFREKPLRGVCQYHRDILPAKAVRDALMTHRSAYIGGVLNRDNLYYIPPELLLDGGEGSNSAKQGEWMCQQIVRVLEAEQKRDKALDALAEANRNLEQRVKERTAELEITNKYLESFSYSVSHDLRAPLRSIHGFSQILAQDFGDVLGEEGREHLSRVCENTRNMEELIEGLLKLSRVIKADLQYERIDLSSLAEEVRREICESEPGRSQEFVIQKGLRAIGDRALLRNVLANLFGNAWKFTSKCAHTRIEFGETQTKAGQTALFVKDNGAGFEMQSAKNLFGAFQRMHRQDEFPGTGIGLATVQRIITKHRGRIWAESARDHGATFFFSLTDEHSDV